MSSTVPKGRTNSTLRKFLDNEASGGLVLMAVAFIAIVVANSPLAETYFHLLHVYIGPLSLQHWVNDALMAVFFLLVGLEIKREMLDGQLSNCGISMKIVGHTCRPASSQRLSVRSPTMCG